MTVQKPKIWIPLWHTEVKAKYSSSTTTAVYHFTPKKYHIFLYFRAATDYLMYRNQLHLLMKNNDNVIKKIEEVNWNGNLQMLVTVANIQTNQSFTFNAVTK